MIKPNYYWPAIVAAASIYSILLGIFFPDLSFRWPMFFLWFVPVIGMVCLHVLPEAGEERHPLNGDCLLPNEKHLHYLLIVLFSLPFIVYLSTYPFVAIHDEIRDGALRAQEIAIGKIQHIFGHDWSQGLIFAAMSSLLYHLTGPSVLCYRLLGALFGVLSILLMYFGFGRIIGYRRALIAAVILASNQAFLFFGRTESLIEIGTLVTLAAFLVCLRLIRARSEKLFSIAMITGLLVGFSLGMHASARPPVVLFALIGIGGMWINTYRGCVRWQSAITATGAIAFFTLVGFGPQILFYSLDFIMGAGSGRFDLALNELIASYLDSLGALFNRTMAAHFSGQRLLALDISTALPVAVILALWCRDLASCLSLAGILFLLASNSALTNLINGGHRLLALVPFVSIIVADLLARLVNLKNRTIAAFVLGVFLVLRGAEVRDFFGSFRATAHIPPEVLLPLDLSLRHLFNHVQSDPRWKDEKELVIYVRNNSPVYSELMPPHVVEAFWFFLRDKTMSVQPVEGLPESALFISSRKVDRPQIQSWPLLRFCPGAGRFACGQTALPIYEDPDFSEVQPVPFAPPQEDASSDVSPG